ncbi:tRNA adenosine(34) deaminase TadA [Variovorax sp. PAMC26660]|uniref:tRNA adenosine(34) deaminase TadA n=1 Tax=Variovorax sp. PAMC26660 TaxID=2762322 RepID=UPI00164DDEC0|nr:tRNA adenosine(34) deaminase TadA [Variovorax sp. PAMC26660]QNK67560.1 tRNA adenosine(34) deaminase TadA [Variovorax sp. PAMC26660]
MTTEPALPSQMNDDARWMTLALAEARLAAEAGEVPVGAVLVKDGQVIATGRNTPVANHDPSAHAEINALRAGATVLGNYRLDGCELFVTLEPCAMCAGAMLHSRLARVVFGATDPKTGAAGSVLDLFAEPRLNHRTQVQGGVLAQECAAVLQAFFQQRRSVAREQAEPLRDDALRTPAERFAALGDCAFAAHHVQDLPSLQGWRMHYMDESGEGDPLAGCLCLHGPGEWGYFFRHFVGAPGLRTLVPDLIGFGKSDKPKRETTHTLEWHRDVLLEWLDRLQLAPVVLVHSASAASLAALLQAVSGDRFVATLVAPEGGERIKDAWRAPFPDRGYEAALRALGPIASSSGPTPAQARALALQARNAMGYSTS